MARADLKNHFQIGLLVSLGPPHIGTTTQGEAKIIFQKSIFMPGPTRRVQINDSQMRREPYTNQTQPALSFSGNPVSNPNAVVLVAQ